MPDARLPERTRSALEALPRQRDRRSPAVLEIPPLPPPPPARLVRRVLTHPRFAPFHRLVLLVAVANLAALAHGLGAGWWEQGRIDHLALSRMVVANLALAVLIRSQHVVNLLFGLATNAPTRWPFPVRRALGKIYHLGGLHVGGAVAGTAWFAAAAGSLLYDRWADGGARPSWAALAVSALLVILLVTMSLLATPGRRARRHDRFELSHRFGGWAALGLFWAQTVLLTRDLHGSLVGEWSVWLLAVLTGSVALPWLRLRRVPVAISAPSGHVGLATFDYGLTPRVGYAFSISRRPLGDWHAFASVPTPGREGFRLAVSRAGDWTGRFVDERPGHVWVRGVPTAGMAKIEALFTRVVFVATGSGIGPCLPFLLSRQAPSRLVWSTRSPRETYGEDLVQEILTVQPDALIWDTDVSGRPDLLALAHRAAVEFGAEAVVVVANQSLTRRVVHGLEIRGIAAYGAIWDS